jgi:hypothetical protein
MRQHAKKLDARRFASLQSCSMPAWLLLPPPLPPPPPPPLPPPPLLPPLPPPLLPRRLLHRRHKQIS